MSQWIAAAHAIDSVIEEIVVTAEKREQSLQDVPLSVTALTGSDLDKSNIFNLIDLSGQAPGLTIASSEGFRRSLTIRGLGLEAAQNDIANPSVAFHVDGMYISSDISTNADLMDIERIEILRGPQGTVFGQNAIGGAINVVTKAPSTEATYGHVDLAAGSEGTVNVRGSVNIGNGGSHALRLSGSHRSHDGYSTNILLGQELDDEEAFTLRAQYLWQPSDTFSLIARAQRFDLESNGRAQKSINDATPGPRNLAHDFPDFFDFESTHLSLTAQWELPAFTIKSITGYQSDDADLARDNDRLPIPLDIVTTVIKELDTFTQEINIVSNHERFESVDWILGAFYLDFDHRSVFLEFGDFNGDGMIDTTVNTSDPFSNPDLGFQTDTTPNRQSWSIFAQGTYHWSDVFRTTAGLRYTDDEVTANVSNFFGAFGTTPLSQDDTAVTGKLDFQWDASADNLLYFSYSRGFKPGGSNLTFGTLVSPTYEEETVNAFEIGSKNRFLDNAVQLNVSTYFYDYEGLQFQATDPQRFSGGVDNISESEIFGLELELSAYLSDAFRVDFSYTYLDTEITSDNLVLDNVAADAIDQVSAAAGLNLFGPEATAARAAAIGTVKGNSLPKAPENVFNLALTYDLELGGGVLTSRVQFIHRDEFSYRLYNNVATDILPSYDLVNLHVQWVPSDANWTLALIASNVTDEDAVNARFTDAFGVVSTGDELVPPRIVMVRFGYDFK